MSAQPKVVLKRGFKGTPRFGHPWIYRTQIQEAAASPGALVDVISDAGHFLGRGYYNPRSEITVRLLTYRKEPIDKAFFKARIGEALEFRKRFVRDTNACRLVSSEGDDLPGLIVDQYGEILVVQFLTMGMERLRPLVLEALGESIPSKGLYERSDSSSRKLEGLEEKVGWIGQGPADTMVIQERDIRYNMRFGGGHKTGFYLDQRDNRFLLRDLGVKGEVLDAFCYTGGFGLHLAAAGCHVLGIEIQKEAVSQAEENRALNGISPEALGFRVGNVFDELRALEKGKKKFDLVILDPPSFVKKKEALEGALAGYKEIGLRSMKLLNDHGLLAVFSCSYHIDDSLLMQTCLSAAVDAHKSLKVLKFMKQSGDHPINPFIPETYYLKGFLFQVSPAIIGA